MKSSTSLQCFLTVFISCFVSLRCDAQILNLYEGDICRKSRGKSSNYICRDIDDCPVAKEGIKKNIIPQLCSFKESKPIVCCPPTNTMHTVHPTTSTTSTKPTVNNNHKTHSATEMCGNYSELIYRIMKDPILKPNQNNYIKFKDCYDATVLITNGTKTEPKEFPHMALLGYSEKPDIYSWACGGSLISVRFVLTAAHCEKLGSKAFAVWARLGDLDYLSDTDIARPMDYKIVERIIHPNYKPPSLYNDIALFRLERDVVFSPFVRPVCLNTDRLLKPPAIIATGWGKTDVGGPTSSHLLKVSIDTISTEECDKSFLYMTNRKQKISQGIVDDFMLCAGNAEGGNDTCGGDSGGPIQIKHNKYICMYSQVGITSFAGPFCGEKDSPGVYTRVSKYISWIEQIVWPKN